MTIMLDLWPRKGIPLLVWMILVGLDRQQRPQRLFGGQWGEGNRLV